MAAPLQITPVIVPRGVRRVGDKFELRLALCFRFKLEGGPVNGLLRKWPETVEKYFIGAAATLKIRFNRTLAPMPPNWSGEFKVDFEPLKTGTDHKPQTAWNLLFEQTFDPVAVAKGIAKDVTDSCKSFLFKASTKGATNSINPPGASEQRPGQRMDSIDTAAIRNAYLSSTALETAPPTPEQQAALRKAALQRERFQRHIEAVRQGIPKKEDITRKGVDFKTRMAEIASHTGFLRALGMTLRGTVTLSESELKAISPAWMVEARPGPIKEGGESVEWLPSSTLCNLTEAEFTPRWADGFAGLTRGRFPGSAFTPTQQDFVSMLVPDAKATGPARLNGGGVAMVVNYSHAFKDASAANFIARTISEDKETYFHSTDALKLMRGFLFEVALDKPEETKRIYRPLCARRSRLRVARDIPGYKQGDVILDVEEESSLFATPAQQEHLICAQAETAPLLGIDGVASLDAQVIQQCRDSGAWCLATKSTVRIRAALKAASGQNSDADATLIRGIFHAGLGWDDIKAKDHLLYPKQSDGINAPLAFIQVLPIFKLEVPPATAAPINRFLASSLQRGNERFPIVLSAHASVALDKDGLPDGNIISEPKPEPAPGTPAELKLGGLDKKQFTIEGERRNYAWDKASLAEVKSLAVDDTVVADAVSCQGLPFADATVDHFSPARAEDRLGVLNLPFVAGGRKWLFAEGPIAEVLGQVLAASKPGNLKKITVTDDTAVRFQFSGLVKIVNNVVTLFRPTGPACPDIKFEEVAAPGEDNIVRGSGLVIGNVFHATRIEIYDQKSNAEKPFDATQAQQIAYRARFIMSVDVKTDAGVSTVTFEDLERTGGDRAIDPKTLLAGQWITALGTVTPEGPIAARAWPRTIHGTFVAFEDGGTSFRIALQNGKVLRFSCEKPADPNAFTSKTAHWSLTTDSKGQTKVSQAGANERPFELLGELVDVSLSRTDGLVDLTLAAIPALSVVAPSAQSALPNQDRAKWTVRVAADTAIKALDNAPVKPENAMNHDRAIRDLELGETLHVTWARILVTAETKNNQTTRIVDGALEFDKTKGGISAGFIGRLEFPPNAAGAVVREGSADYQPAKLATAHGNSRPVWCRTEPGDASRLNGQVVALNAPPHLFTQRLVQQPEQFSSAPVSVVEAAHVVVNDILARWNGWPIAVPPPGRSEVCKDQPASERKYTIECSPLNVGAQGGHGGDCDCALCADARKKAATPEAEWIAQRRRVQTLRHDRHYRFRMGYCDLAGDNTLEDLELYPDQVVFKGIDDKLANPIFSHAKEDNATSASPDDLKKDPNAGAKPVPYRRSDPPGAQQVAFLHSGGEVSPTPPANGDPTTATIVRDKRAVRMVRITHPLTTDADGTWARALTIAKEVTSPTSRQATDAARLKLEMVLEATQCSILPSPAAVETVIASGRLDRPGAKSARDLFDLIKGREQYIADGRLLFKKLGADGRGGAYNYFTEPAIPDVGATGIAAADGAGLRIELDRDSADVGVATAHAVLDELLVDQTTPVEYTGAWPNPNPIAVNLCARLEKMVPGEARVILPPGRRGTCIVRSFLPGPDKTKEHVREIPVEAIHAVTSPVSRPSWERLYDAERAPDATAQSYQAAVVVDAPSSGALQVTAYWNEYWDEPTPALFIPAVLDVRIGQIVRKIDAQTYETFHGVTRCRVIDPGCGYGTQVILRTTLCGKWRPGNNEPGIPDANLYHAVLKPVLEGGRVVRVDVVDPGRYEPPADLDSKKDAVPALNGACRNDNLSLPSDKVEVEILRRPPLYLFARGWIHVESNGSLATTVRMEDTEGRSGNSGVSRSAGYYPAPPIAVVLDQDGEGVGAKLRAELDEFGQVASVTVLDRGWNYGLPAKRGNIDLPVMFYTHSAVFQEEHIPNRPIAARALIIDRRVVDVRWEKNAEARMLRSMKWDRKPVIAVHDLDGNGASAEVEASMLAEGSKLVFDPQRPFVIKSGGAGYTQRVAVGIYVDERERDENPVPVDSRQVFKWSFDHAFGDARSRRVDYVAQVSSRFRTLLHELKYRDPAARGDPARELLDAFVPRSTIPREVEVPATAAPMRPVVDYIIPVFDWWKAPDKSLIESRTWAGTRAVSLRIYLERPWNVTGHEYLGIVIFNADSNSTKLKVKPADPAKALDPNAAVMIPNEYRGCVSRWGFDPVWGAAQLPPIRLDDLTSAQKVVPYGDLAEFAGSDQPPVGVGLHKVEYDRKKERWYADIGLRVPADCAPFVQLALVRYQEHAIPGRKMSSVVVPDMVQVPGERRLFVSEQGASKGSENGVREFSITYAGNFEEILKDRAARIEADAKAEVTARKRGLAAPARALVAAPPAPPAPGPVVAPMGLVENGNATPAALPRQDVHRKVVAEFRLQDPDMPDVEGDLMHSSLGSAANDLDVFELRLEPRVKDLDLLKDEPKPNEKPCPSAVEYVFRCVAKFVPALRATAKDPSKVPHLVIKEYEVYPTTESQIDHTGTRSYPAPGSNSTRRAQFLVDRLVFVKHLPLSAIEQR